MITLQEISDSIKQTGKFWIAFVGDSITSCEWVHPNWREIVEYVLKEELTKISDDWKTPSWGLRTFNFGYDGSTTKDILDKVSDIKLVNPGLVIMMIGANDPILNISVEDHVGNLKKIINSFENIHFSTDNCPWNEGVEGKYQSYVEADIKSDFSNFINLFEESKKFPNEKIYTFKSEENVEEAIKEGELDYWHPNQLGNAYIAKVILKEVFGIEFDPEIYWKTNLAGEKFPKY